LSETPLYAFVVRKRAVELELATILQLGAAQAGGDFLTGKNYRYRTAAFTLW
jgi:hypothetical protein